MVTNGPRRLIVIYDAHQYVEHWNAKPASVVRMHRLPQDELPDALSVVKADGELDKQTAIRPRRKLAEEFREQLTVGVPTNEDEAGLRRMASVKPVV